jgi:hypothetical protein
MGLHARDPGPRPGVRGSGGSTATIRALERARLASREVDRRTVTSVHAVQCLVERGLQARIRARPTIPRPGSCASNSSTPGSRQSGRVPTDSPTHPGKGQALPCRGLRDGPRNRRCSSRPGSRRGYLRAPVRRATTAAPSDICRNERMIPRSRRERRSRCCRRCSRRFPDRPSLFGHVKPRVQAPACGPVLRGAPASPTRGCGRDRRESGRPPAD